MEDEKDTTKIAAANFILESIKKGSIFNTLVIFKKYKSNFYGETIELIKLNKNYIDQIVESVLSLKKLSPVVIDVIFDLVKDSSVKNNTLRLSIISNHLKSDPYDLNYKFKLKESEFVEEITSMIKVLQSDFPSK